MSSSVSAINATTIQGDGSYLVTVNLTSATPGAAWTASSTSSWIKFTTSSGTTPAALQVVLDASQLPAGTSQGTVTVTSSTGSFTVPVTLQVDALAVTVIRSDPASAKVYAISEAAVTSGTSRAYLLEIDSLQQKITRVLPVGTSATDLAIHHADNRIYVPNWMPGGLLAVNLTSFQLEKTYAMAPFGGVGYSTNDVYRVSAGRTGRLVTEAEDQWIDVNLYNTTTGAVLSTSFQREGGGQCDPTGRYYYHGDYDDSDSMLHKLDTSGDTLTSIKTASITGIGGYGSRTVVMSEDGSRVFWNGGVFDADLNVVWSTDKEVCSTSTDGRYAFSQTTIYDTQKKQPVAAMPVSTTVSAYNSTTGRLVVQNGAALGFYTPVGPGLLGDALAPKDGSIVLAPAKLQWKAMPGVDSYRVFLGTSLNAVTRATVSSPEYLGVFTTASCNLTTAPQSGQAYYWRVDLLMGGNVVASQVQSFTVGVIAPDVFSIDATTVQGNGGYKVAVNLTSAAPGVAWTVNSASPWISFVANSGTTPATLQIVLDASQLPAGINQGTVTVTSATGSFTLPVTLQVDALALTVIRSDPTSAKVYAISEAAVTSGTSRAYLLEIDSLQQKITRVLPVGTSATDLAIHHGDNRIYVPNWLPGGLLAVNIGTFQVEKTYATPPYNSYGDNDVYRVSAGSAGRLVTEAEDQWINVNLYSTTTGAVLSTSFQREGGGQYDPTGRYYYHGDYDDSDSMLHKLDTSGDTLTSVKTASITTGVSYYGARTVVVSEDGSRVFWNGGVFDANLNVVWSVGVEIFASSADGHYGFGESKIYDLLARTVVFGMPATTRVSAFNSTTGKLVLQQGQRLGFYTLTTNGTLLAPVLAAGTITSTSVKLTWTEDALQNGFTLQMRTAGAASWTDVSAAIPSTSTSYTVTGLQSETAYEFYLRADSPTISSGWSNIVAATTLSAPPSTPSFTSLTATSPTATVLQWTVSGAYDSVTIERSISPSPSPTVWTSVATVSAGVLTYNDTPLTALTTYVYRLKATRKGVDSAYSYTASVTLQPPAAPAITRPPVSQTVVAGSTVTLSVSTTGNPLPTFQWYKNDVAISGATSASYVITTVLPADAGKYTVVVTNAIGSTTSSAGTLTVSAGGRLTSISVRGPAGTGDQTLILGFYVGGTGSKQVLVRGIGPTLAQYGVGGVLADPQLKLFNTAGTQINQNDDWGGSAVFANVFTSVNAFALPVNSKDAALLVALPPTGYTAQVNGAGTSTGVALVEAYEADTGTPSARFTALSARNQVGTGDNILIVGFVVNGNSPKALLIRGIGPALASFGVSGVLADPKLELYAGQTKITENDNWGGTTALTNAFTATQAFPLSDANSKDAALLVTLSPGLYSAQVSGVGGTTGIALIEVYEMDSLPASSDAPGTAPAAPATPTIPVDPGTTPVQPSN